MTTETAYTTHLTTWQNPTTTDHELMRHLTITHPFSWTDLARMLHVGVPLLRMWRMGDPIPDDARKRMARLAAVVDVLSDHSIEPVAWFSRWFHPETHSVAPKDVYGFADPVALLDVAVGGADPDAFLDAVAPAWRNAYSLRGFRVSRFDDGTYGTTVAR